MQLTRRLNTLKRYAFIKQLTNEYYEPENQSKCKRQALKRHVNPVYPISERAFYHIMGTDVDKEIKEINKQMEIEFNS